VYVLKRAARAIGLDRLRERAHWYRLRRLVVVSPCPNLVRLGSRYGGYVIPTHLPDPTWVAYCGGIGDDASFELELARRYGCHVIALDPTPSALRYAEQELKSTGVAFLPYGLWSEDGEQRFYEPRQPEHASYSIPDLQETGRFIVAVCRSLESLMDELAHDRLNLLKLDIEGAEYKVLEPLVENRLRVDVLCVELHPIPSFDAMPLCLQRLESVGYRVVHIEHTTVTLVDARHVPEPTVSLGT
jgi:FkbM family methyltransferase